MKDVVRPVEVSIRPDDARSRAVSLVSAIPHRIVAVVDEEGVLRGVVSDYDLAVKKGDRVRDLMTPDPAAVNLEDNLLTAYRLMRVRGLRKLPVYEEKNGRKLFKGFITSDDIIEALVRKL